MSGWKKVKLGDCCVENGIQTGPFGSQLHQSDYSEAGTPVIMPKDIRDGRVVEDGIARVGEVHVKRLSRHRVAKNNIVYPRRGDVGKAAFITEKEVGWLCGTGCLKVDLNEDVVDPVFIRYFLALNDSVSWLEKHAVGSTMLNINAGILAELPIALPPLPTQRRIAAMLSDYDSAIDNARRQIALLEEAAMRLYREWFVVNADPMWEKKRIVDVCSRIGAGGTPNRRQEKYWLNGTIDWIKTKELQDCWLFDSEEKITSAGLDESSAKIYPANTVVMAIYASPTLGRLGILDKPMCCNQAALCLVADESQVSWEWLYCQLFELRDEFNRIARGAGQQNISGEVVKETVVRIPDIHAMSEFTNAARPLFSQCRSLGRQIRSLTEARNRLLPKLMSGEVEV